eukprot:scaffold66176_cov37-Phaeocystis_antarctica.AAC.1
MAAPRHFARCKAGFHLLGYECPLVRPEVVAHLGLPGRLTLHRGRAWTFMPADLVGQDAPRQRIFSRILG